MADGSVTIEVTLTKNQLEKGLKSLKSTINNALPSASKTLSTFANGFSKLGSLATSAGKACSTVTASVIGVFTAAGAKAKNFITTYEGAINLFKKKFGDTGAKEMYESLLKIAKASTFAQESIVSAGQTMVAMGISGKKTAKYMQLVTDAVAGMGGTGSDIESLAAAIGKMSNQVTLHTDDLNQLATQGLPVWDVLAKKYGKTKEAVQDMASKGMLPAAETLDFITDALEGNIKGFEQWSVAGNALSQKGGTLKGALDGLNSSIRSFGLNLLGMNINKDQVANYQKLIQVVNLVGKTIENVGSKFSFVSDWIGTGLDKAKSVLENFNNTLDKMGTEKLQNIAKAILGLATAGPALLGVGKGFNILSGGFSALGKGAKVIEELNSKILNTSKSMLTWIGNNDKLKSNLAGLIVGGFMKTNMAIDTVKGKVPMLTSMLSNVSSGISGTFSKFTGAISSTFPNVTSGLSKITGAFGGLFGNIGSKMGDFLPIFTKGFNITAIIGLVVAGLGILQGQFGEQINNFLSMVTQKGPEIITNLVNGIVSKIPDLIAKGSELLQNLLTAIIANLPAIIQGGIQIISSLVIGIAQQLPTLIPMAIEAIITIVTSLLDNIDLLIDAAIELIMGLAEGLITAIPILIEKIPVIIEKLINAIVNNLPKLIQMGIELIVKLAEGLVKAIPQLIAALPQIISALVNGLGQLVGMVWDIGKNIVKGLWNGISNMASWLWNKISGWCSSIFDGIKNFFGIHSPSKLFNKEIGKYLALGLGEGFDDNLSKVYNKMQSAVDFETQKLSANLSTTANVNRNLNVSLNQSKSDVVMDGRKVAQVVTPYISQTVRMGGI